jgi:release factor glutamine methyltransferase
MKTESRSAMNIKNALQNLPIDRLDAEVLLAHVLQVNRTYLHTHPERNISQDEEDRFFETVKKRKQGTPVVYLTEEKEFWSLSLKVTPDTLIPRPETEVLVEVMLEMFEDKNRPYRFLELATGCGAVSVALAKTRQNFNMTATDICEKALSVARENQQRHHIENLSFIQGDWFSPFKNTDKFDAILCNPPYVAGNDPYLSEGDLPFEPKIALTPGETGFEAILHIIQKAKDHLCPSNGWLFIEHGYDQGEKVAELLRKNGYYRVSAKKDLNNFSRVTFGAVSDV